MEPRSQIAYQQFPLGRIVEDVTFAQKIKLTVEEETHLWLRHAKVDSEARAILIDYYLPFARMIAAKCYAKRQVQELQFEDFMHYAIVGLIESIDRFDSSQHVGFKTYASYRIKGEILNSLDKLSEQQQQIGFRKRLRQDRAESLTATKPLTESDNLFIELADMAIGLALGYLLEDSGMYQTEELAASADVYQGVELKQLQGIVRGLVDMLPEREKMIMKYHYYQGVSFEDIAKIMQLTKGRISQIHKQALASLRERYQKSYCVNILL